MSSNIRLTVDLAAIEANWRSLGEAVFPAECAASVKADAYGLGMPRVAERLHAAGCRSFFVAHVEEGLDLRDLLRDADNYLLNGVPAGEEKQVFAAELTPIVNSLDELARIKAVQSGASIALHVDTGMNRLGLDEADIMTLRERRQLLDGVTVKLVMSHFVAAENQAHPLNKRQRERFVKALEALPTAKTSMANSSGIFLGASYRFDMVRPGAGLYGINPTPGKPSPVRQVVKLEARILQVHEVKAGETVGYGADFLVEKPSRTATLGIGYADGVPRRLSNRGYVYAAGRKLPIIGRVSMDLMTIDITAAPPGALSPGAFVEILGPNRPLDEVAEEAETIGYEMLTRLGRRFTRLYEAL